MSDVTVIREVPGSNAGLGPTILRHFVTLRGDPCQVLGWHLLTGHDFLSASLLISTSHIMQRFSNILINITYDKYADRSLLKVIFISNVRKKRGDLIKYF
jgi:hypothetical protein